jgi:uncharacterized protein YccT (UPF0319 family)
MKLPVIKSLVEQNSLAQLQQAEEAIVNEKTPAIEVKGDDEGEQLTHVLAAIYIKEQMAAGMDYMSALRQYTQRVRTSIS